MQEPMMATAPAPAHQHAQRTMMTVMWKKSLNPANPPLEDLAKILPPPSQSSICWNLCTGKLAFYAFQSYRCSRFSKRMKATEDAQNLEVLQKNAQASMFERCISRVIRLMSPSDASKCIFPLTALSDVCDSSRTGPSS